MYLASALAALLGAPQSPASDAVVEGARRLDSADLTAWLDGRMPYALRQGDIAGGVVVVVKGGRVLVERGYGLSDVARKLPVIPESTLFRVGSVSKLFTWTAVMQLVEQGKVDLDRDINGYLDFEIPARRGRPITLRNLMTHTPGFAEVLKHLASYDSTHIFGLGPYLKSGTPDRLFPPGEVTAYSNYGAALAGYIVERVSGQPFADYVDRHILGPLGMARSSLHQPLPAPLRPLLAKGYVLGSGAEQPFEMIPASPAGGLSATGDDIARFMIAHLDSGAYGSTRILGPETARLMHDTPLTIVPAVHRMLLGFYENDQGGHRVIAHGGDTQWFHSELQLFVDDGIGLFAAVNSTGRDGAAWAVLGTLIRDFAERYLPGTAPDGQLDSVVAAGHARMIAGRYDGSVQDANLFSLLKLLAQATVTAQPDGTITVSAFADASGRSKRWREIAPFVWRDVDGPDRLGAKVEAGRVVMFSADETSTSTVFLPTPWWRSSAWLVPGLKASLLVLVLTIAQWPIAVVARRRYGSAPPAAPAAAITKRNRLAALAVVGTFAAFAATIVLMISDFTLLTPSLDWWVWLLHLLALIAFVGGAGAALWNTGRTWASRPPWFTRLWTSAVAASCLVILWTAVAFKLIGFTARY
ncbi:MAG: serine hydrolase domain-containing protein [Gemmatimonadota bacterium]